MIQLYVPGKLYSLLEFAFCFNTVLSSKVTAFELKTCGICYSLHPGRVTVDDKKIEFNSVWLWKFYKLKVGEWYCKRRLKEKFKISMQHGLFSFPPFKSLFFFAEDMEIVHNILVSLWSDVFYGRTIVTTMWLWW